MILNEELLFDVGVRVAEILPTAATRPGVSSLVNLETGDYAIYVDILPCVPKSRIVVYYL